MSHFKIAFQMVTIICVRKLSKIYGKPIYRKYEWKILPIGFWHIWWNTGRSEKKEFYNGVGR